MQVFAMQLRAFMPKAMPSIKVSSMELFRNYASHSTLGRIGVRSLSTMGMSSIDAVSSDDEGKNNNDKPRRSGNSDRYDRRDDRPRSNSRDGYSRSRDNRNSRYSSRPSRQGDYNRNRSSNVDEIENWRDDSWTLIEPKNKRNSYSNGRNDRDGNDRNRSDRNDRYGNNRDRNDRNDRNRSDRYGNNRDRNDRNRSDRNDRYGNNRDRNDRDRNNRDRNNRDRNDRYDSRNRRDDRNDRNDYNQKTNSMNAISFNKDLLNSNITKDVDLKNDIEVITGLYPVYSILHNNAREVFNLCVRISNETDHAENKQSIYDNIFTLAKEKNIPIVEIPSKVFDEEFGNRKSQGLGLKCKKIHWQPIDTIDELIPAKTNDKRTPIIICLDRITDPVNLGSIIRTASYYGVNGIVTEESNTAPLNSVCSTCSGGSIDLLYKQHQLTATKDINQFLLDAQNKNWTILTTDVKNGTPLNTYIDHLKSLIIPTATTTPSLIPSESVHEPTTTTTTTTTTTDATTIPTTSIKDFKHKPIVLILGNEGLGVRQSVKKCCTDIITIPRPEPMNMNINSEDLSIYDSLNVNVSLAVLLNSLTNV